VNAVNLLPAKHRPRTPTGGQQGSSYAVIGILGVVCVMVLLFVLTTNGINTSKQSISRTQAETAQAKKRAEELAPYGNFIQIKEQRVSSVKQLATGRIDWERLARGLAHVLPEKVWLLTASASASGDPGSGGGASGAQSAPPPAPAGGGGASGGAPADPSGGAGAPKPSLNLKGCAVNHPAVAVTLVRLRHLPAVEDVTLSSINKPEVTAGSGASAAGAGGGEDCGRINKKAVYTWEAQVTFKPQPGSTPGTPEKKDKVPAALGGGA
jgi:Tfp pilus assembly protein PilN